MNNKELLKQMEGFKSITVIARSPKTQKMSPKDALLKVLKDGKE